MTGLALDMIGVFFFRETHIGIQRYVNKIVDYSIIRPSPILETNSSVQNKGPIKAIRWSSIQLQKACKTSHLVEVWVLPSLEWINQSQLIPTWEPQTFLSYLDPLIFPPPESQSKSSVTDHQSYLLEEAIPTASQRIKIQPEMGCGISVERNWGTCNLCVKTHRMEIR